MTTAVDFKTQLQNNILVFDGALGTMLQNAGLRPGQLPETLNIEQPEVVRGIHRLYVEAGADIISTNTFGASENKLKNTPYTVEEIIVAGVRLAQQADPKWVALDIGPMGQMMQPLGDLTFNEAYEHYRRQVVVGEKAGVDLILLETFSDLHEIKAAILAAKENTGLPIIATMTFQKDGRTFFGTDPMTATLVLQGLGIDALGINCSLGPKEMLPLLHQILPYARTPVMVQANAGLPYVKDHQTLFPTGPVEFSSYVRLMLEQGVSVIGGCCGTTPKHIAAIKEATRDVIPQYRVPIALTCACSATQTVVFNDRTVIIGERINPTGKKHLKQALRHNKLDFILSEAIDQVTAGAEVLDVNVGLPEIAEQEVLPQVVGQIQGVVDRPLQIDSINAKAIEAALRIYNGKPIVNSVNGQDDILEQILPLVKKYGASVIGLTLDEKGVPETAEERLAIAQKILRRTQDYGIPPEDVLIDCLVLTASAQQSLVAETLKAVALVKRELGVQTVLGISNVSYGLPQRPLLNRTFLAAALGVGLDAAIIDPLDGKMVDTVRAFRVLSNEDREAKAFIATYQGLKMPVSTTLASSKDLAQLIKEGRKAEVVAEIKRVLQEKDAVFVIDEIIIPTLDDIGRKYESGQYFLPQLLRSADAVKEGLGVLKSFALQGSQGTNKGKIVLATVKGDIHDIGKNIAKIFLENYGYDVVDLGKDVAVSKIVETVKEHQIKLVGLSALMTTTVSSMQQTVEALKRDAPQCQVMVGGAVLNPQYADMIGAHHYASDAQAGVRIAQRVFSNP